MSFINWGSESPEQLAIRRRLEQEAIYEQAARMARARQRAGQAPAVAGGSANEVLPSYCGGNKVRVETTQFFADVLKPNSNPFTPTAEDFDTYDPVTEAPLETATIIYRDSYLKAENENLLAEFFSKLPANYVLPSPVPPPSKFYKIDVPLSSPSSWFCKEVNKYETWADSGASLEMPEVVELNTRNAVENGGALPGTGNPGDIIFIIDPGKWRAWDKNTNTWSSAYYETYIEPTHSVMAQRRDTHLKRKREICAALLPFVYSSKYIPEFRIKKDNL